MMIMSHVSVEFRDKEGNSLMVIPESQINKLIYDAPEGIRQDPLFDLMVADGSLVATDRNACKELEADPLAGLTAEGKKDMPRKKVPKEGAEGAKENAGAKDAAPVKETKKKAETASGGMKVFGPEQKP